MRQKGTDVTTKIVNGFYADDLRITIDERGDGRPVLLLHGGGGPPTMEPLTTALCDDFRVIAPVHPGFDGTRDRGGSTRSTTSRSAICSYSSRLRNPRLRAPDKL
jgi:pimeloyl-ACP methyl ester carboxylesterase